MRYPGRYHLLLFLSCLVTLAAVLLFLGILSSGARGEADLSVSLELPETVASGDKFNASVTLSHSGDATSGVNLSLFLNHPQRGGVLLHYLEEDFAAGPEDRTIDVTLPEVSARGYRDVYAFVDPEDEITESDEDNNQARETVLYQESYDDVLLIINNNSAASKEIGHYFAEKRNVKHVLYLEDAATTETVSRDAFESTIMDPVKSYLENETKENEINYFVTTKGVPLRVNQKDVTDDRASVDSELALVNGPYESYIGGNGRFSQPYHNETERFSHEEFGIYLVTRLTAYTVEEAKGLVDKALNASEPGWDAVLGTGMMILDVDPGRDGGTYEIGNDWLRAAYTNLENRGFNAYLEKNNTYILNQDNVSLYASWGSNDGHDVFYHDKNNGMETDDGHGVPDHWSYSEGTGEMTRTNEDQQAGSWSVRVNRTASGEESCLLQELRPDARKRYYFTGYVNLTGVTGSGGLRLEVRHYDSEDKLIHSAQGSYRKGTTDWVTLDQCHLEAIPGTDHVEFGVVFRDATGLAYIDTVRCVEVVPHNSYLDGSLAETIVSTGGRSFTYGTDYGQSLVADILMAGVTGVKGYVYEPYLDAISHPDILFSRYVDGWTLGESYFCGSNYLSWMGVVVGDPKLAPFKSYQIDLEVEALTLSDNEPVVEKGFDVQTVVANTGGLAAENVTHTIFQEDPSKGVVIKSYFIPRLAPGEFVIFNASWQFNDTGNFYIYSDVDYADEIDEGREDNNELRERARVVTPPDIHGWLTDPQGPGETYPLGRKVFINFTVENQGGKSAEDLDLRVKILDRDTPSSELLHEETLEELEDEDERSFKLEWPATVSGNLSILVELDPRDTVEESDESNNVFSLNFWVNEPPVAVVQKEEANGQKGQNIRFFAGESFDPDGSLVNYIWEIKGKEDLDLHGQNVSFILDKTGNYTVTLTVTDNSSAVNKTEFVYFVNAPPKALFLVSYLGETRNFNIHEELLFNGSYSRDDEGKLVSYLWDFGDGNVSGEGLIVNHAYTRPGHYNVTLTLEDEHGGSASYTKELDILDRAPWLRNIVLENGADFSSLESIVFNASEEPGNEFPVVRAVWDFGDGTSLEEDDLRAVEHSYEKGGTYTVTLKAYEELGSKTVLTRELVIANRFPEILGFIIDEQKVFAGLNFTLSYSVRDRDGTIDILQLNVTAVTGGAVLESFALDPEENATVLSFDITGDHKLSLWARDDTGGSTTASFSLDFLESRPTAVMKINHQEGALVDNKQTVTVEFAGDSSYFREGDITGYRWDFGDGTMTEWLQSSEASHIYTKEGRVTATLYVKNELGVEDESQLEVVVSFKGIEKPDDDVGFLGGFDLLMIMAGLAGSVLIVQTRKKRGL